MPRRLFLALLLAFAPAAARAQAGVALDGAWRFRAGDDTAWASPAHDDGDWGAAQVPGEWEAAIGPYDGFGWYRREVQVPAEAAGRPVGLRFGTVGDAYEVYWNGVRIGTSGAFPPRFVEGVPPTLILVPDSALRIRPHGPHLLAIRIYNDYAYGGLMMPVRVGSYEALAQDRSPAPVVIGGLIAAFLAIGIYHLAFFFRRPTSRENLWFAALCLCVSLRGATYAAAVQAWLMPWINPYRVGLLALLAGAPFFAALVNELFGIRSRRSTRVVSWAAAGFFTVAAVLPLRVLAEVNFWLDALLGLGLLLVVARAWSRTRPGAPHRRTLLVGTMTFAATLLYDTASEYVAAIPVARVLPGVPGVFWLGFLVFVLAVGIATAGRWAMTEMTALTDSLTGLSRRHVLQDALRREAERLRRSGGAVALVLIDLDHFKRINDTHGHRTGDEVLARVGRLLRSSARNLDLPARYGGEEFAVLLYDTDLGGALAFAERFRANLQGLRVPVGHGGEVQVTASVGVAVGADLVLPDALIEAADQALYRAKNGGRDRLVSVAVTGADRIEGFVVAH